jgi:hypothetical protein
MTLMHCMLFQGSEMTTITLELFRIGPMEAGTFLPNVAAVREGLSMRRHRYYSK